jgi:hypothetical protein
LFQKSKEKVRVLGARPGEELCMLGSEETCVPWTLTLTTQETVHNDLPVPQFAPL